MKKTDDAARLLVLLALFLAATGALYEWGGSGRRGVRELKRQRYDEALTALRAARGEQPRSAAIRYDEALAHQGKGEADSARALYREAMALSGDVARAAAAYNLGNEAMRAKQFAEAAGFYKDALRIRPGDLDTKRNLEEAIRRMRRPPDPGARPSPGGHGPSEQGPERGPEPQLPQGDKGSKPEPRGGSGDFTRAEAEQWLRALEAQRRASRNEGQGRKQEETGQRDW